MTDDTLALQDRVTGFVRAFGLHQPDQTPCGQTIPVSEAHALGELDRDGPLSQLDLGRRLRLRLRLELTATGRDSAAALAAARAARFVGLLAHIPETETPGRPRRLGATHGGPA